MGPRYSILLPTHNGAKSLEACIRSVLDQEYTDFELVISDNASNDATPEILSRYASHPRVRLARQEHLLEVTDNWSATLAASRGDYVLLLGDDDALLPGYFERADALLARYDDPDVLSYNAYCYAYAGFAGSTIPHYQERFYAPADPIPADGELSIALRRSIVASVFRFDFRFPFIAQPFLVARRAIERLPAGLFGPPFPDFYEVVALLLTAPRFAVSSERLIVISCSPKSMAGSALADDFDTKARDYLGVDLEFPGALPGALMSGNHSTLLTLKRDFGAELADLEIDRGRYVLQQCHAWYLQRRLGSLGTRDLVRRVGLLGARDWPRLAGAASRLLRPSTIRRHLRLGEDGATTTLRPTMRPLAEVADLAAFIAWIEAGQPRRLVAA